MTEHVRVEHLMDVPGDELGTPADAIVECDCGTLHREGDTTHASVCEVVDDD